MTMPPPPPGGFPEDQPYGQPQGDYGQPAGGYGQPGAYGQPPAYGGPNPYGVGGSTQKNNLGGWALGLGIAGLLCCGIFAGIPAIILGRQSQAAAAQGLATNGGQGKAGFILGIIACVWFVIAMILQAAGVIDYNFSSN